MALTWRWPVVGRRRTAERIRAEVTIQGDLSGQLAVGSHNIQVQVGRVHGNLVHVLPAGVVPTPLVRPLPVDLRPARPAVVDRTDETARAVAGAGAGEPVAVVGPTGAGKSTLLRHVAHQQPLIDRYRSVVHLSVGAHSRDDLLQALFEAFYTSNVPMRPSRVELRHLLRSIRAVLVLDDVDLSVDEVHEVRDHVPDCGVVLASGRPEQAVAVGALALPGLPAEAAGWLFARALGRPLDVAEQPVAAQLCQLAGGRPGALLRLAAAAAGFAGSLADYAPTADLGPVPVEAGSPQDRRLLALLGAIPGLQLDAAQLAAISGLPDVPQRLAGWIARGLVQASASAAAPARVFYALPSGLDLDASAWQLEARRAEINDHFAAWAQRERDLVLAPGAETEAVRKVRDDARRGRRWRSVLALGILLEASYLLSGRWDAWRDVALTSLDAARALGDRSAEALALHQVGTHALCSAQVPTATGHLTAALDLRVELGDTAGAAVTRHNLELLIAPLPPPGPPDDPGRGHGGGRKWSPRQIAGAAGAVLVPLAVAAGVWALSGPGGEPTVRFDPAAMRFDPQAGGQPSGPRTVRLDNAGGSTLHVDGVAVAGRDRDEFTVTGTTCSGEVDAGKACTTTVVFSPTGTGDRQAQLVWDVAEATADPRVDLTGAGREPDPSAVSARPVRLAFGTQALSTAGAARRVTLMAPPAGSVDLRALTIEGVQAADFGLDADSCSGTALAPGGTCAASIRFAPTGPGERHALLSVVGPDGRATAAVPLSGTAVAPVDVAPAVRLTPPVLDFAAQALGTASAAQSMTVTNPGSAPVDTSRLRITGSADFTVAEDRCPDQLAAGADCALTVAFTPTAAGPRSARLVIDAPGGPTTPLRGTGVPAAAVDPQVSPPALTFADQRVGAVGPAQDVTVTNRGSTRLDPPRISITGATAGFRTDGGCQGPLAAGGSCTIGMRFAPTVAGINSGILALEFPGLAVRPAVVLTGVATDPAQPVVPALIGHPLADAQRQVTALGLQVGSVTRAPDPDAPPDTVIDQSPLAGATLPVGGAVDLTVSTGPEMVAVPDLVGRPEPFALQQLDEAHLAVGDVTSRPDDEIAAGAVVETSPVAGRSVVRGSPVDLVTSTGPDLRPVPDIVGQSLDAARGLLDRAGLTVGAVGTQSSESVAEGLVLRADPTEGAMVRVGSAVGLVLSSGPAPVAVPDLVGADRRGAVNRLADRGLRLGAVTERADPKVDRGPVLESDPAAGALVRPGSAVDVVVSSGPVVPDVEGVAPEVAGARLVDSGLAVGPTTSESSEQIPDGQAIRTVPAAGTSLPVGTPVQVVVSSGPPVAVPDVIGMSVDEAMIALRTAGLEPGKQCLLATPPDPPRVADIVAPDADCVPDPPDCNRDVDPPDCVPPSDLPACSGSQCVVDTRPRPGLVVDRHSPVTLFYRNQLN